MTKGIHTMSDKETHQSSYETMNQQKSTQSTSADAQTTKKSSDSFKPAKPANMEKQLKSKVQQLEEKIKEQEKEIKDLTIRNMADINNLQQRYQREATNLKAYAHQYLAKDIIDIADALEQAPQSLEGKQKEGIELINTMLQKALAKHQIEPIDPINEPFDHNLHEAMVMQPSDQVKENHIIQVVQKGYKIKDRLLRAARVVVAKNQEDNKKTENNA